MDDVKAFLLGGVLAFVAIFGPIIGIVTFDTYKNAINTEVALRNQYKAYALEAEIVIDTMQRTLLNKYKIKKEFVDDFIKIVKMQAISREGGVAVKVVAESSALGIPDAVYTKMMEEVSNGAYSLRAIQSEMIEVYYKHQAHCMSFPASFIVGSRSTLIDKPSLILSTESKDIIASKELPLNMFK